MFDRESAAEAALSRAIEIASANQLNQVLFEAEKALQEVRTGRRPARTAPEYEPSHEAITVAAAIREMRELAGV